MTNLRSRYQPACWILGLGLLLAVVIVAAPTGRAASLNGGNSIASAPDLPVAQQVASGWSEQAQLPPGLYGEFWRLNAKAGDRLVVDIGVTQDSCSGESRGIFVYAPSVTDYTVGRASPVVDHSTTYHDRDEFVWVAPSSGRWTLFFYGCQNIAYEFTAHVQVFTQTTVTAPSTVAVRHTITIRGRVSKAKGGKIAFTVTALKFRLSKLVVIGRTGAFKWLFTPKTAGVYRVRANYYGDAGHRPSKANLVIHAV